jgi:hypothetical protein
MVRLSLSWVRFRQPLYGRRKCIASDVPVMFRPALSSVATAVASRSRVCPPRGIDEPNAAQREFRRPLLRALNRVLKEVIFGHGKNPIGVAPLFRTCPDTQSDIVPIGSTHSTRPRRYRVQRLHRPLYEIAVE